MISVLFSLFIGAVLALALASIRADLARALAAARAISAELSR